MWKATPPPDVLQAWQRLIAQGHVETHGWAIVPVAILCGVFTFFAVAVRLFMRVVVQRKVDFEDWLISAALVPSLLFYVKVCLGAKHEGGDHHTYDLDVAALVRLGELSFIADLAYIILTTVIKIAILAFYLRLVERTANKAFIYATWTCIGLSLAWFVCFLVSLFQTCTPVSAFWNQADALWRETHHYRCFNQAPMILAACISVILLNFVIAVLPIKVFWKLRMPRRQRIGLIFVFAVGFCASGGAMARAYNVYVAFYGTYDHVWYLYWVQFWTTIEVGISMVCACAPGIRAFYVHYIESGSLASCLKRRFSTSMPGSLIGKPSFDVCVNPHPPPLTPKAPTSQQSYTGRQYFCDKWEGGRVGEGTTTSTAFWSEDEDVEQAWTSVGLNVGMRETSVVVKSVVMVDLERMDSLGPELSLKPSLQRTSTRCSG